MEREKKGDLVTVKKNFMEWIKGLLKRTLHLVGVFNISRLWEILDVDFWWLFHTHTLTYTCLIWLCLLHTLGRKEKARGMQGVNGWMDWGNKVLNYDDGWWGKWRKNEDGLDGYFHVWIKSYEGIQTLYEIGLKIENWGVKDEEWRMKNEHGEWRMENGWIDIVC